jgi:hypothetical protein
MKMWTEILLLFGNQTEEMPQGAARERKFINLKLIIIEPIYGSVISILFMSDRIFFHRISRYS